MKKMSNQVIFFGNEKLATGVDTQALAFKGLIDAGYRITALIISQKPSRDTDKLEVVRLAKQAGIEVKSFAKLKDSIEEIKEYKAEIAVLAAYGKIVPKEIINIFNRGIINIHPSLLPKHRGPIPIESVILDGDTETGVSIMDLAPEMDAGPIYAQRSIKITGKETKQELANILDKLGSEMLLDCLDRILTDDLTAEPQPEIGAKYDSLISKDDGFLNFEQEWSLIERKIRAYHNWPRARYQIADIQISIQSAHIVERSGEPGTYIEYEGSLAIYCKDGLVVIDEMTPAGSKPMSSKSFLLGYSRQIFS